jgi:hypothetical protein
MYKKNMMAQGQTIQRNIVGIDANALGIIE